MTEPDLLSGAEVSPEDLLRAARPFDQTVVQSPWFSVTDVPLYPQARQHLERLVNTCTQPGNDARCATVIAPPGYGKTHLLACLREFLERQNRGYFVYLPPVRASDLSLERQLVRASFDSLFFHSERQHDRLSAALRTRLLAAYDHALSARVLPLHDLGIGWTLLGLFNRRFHHLKKRPTDQQDAALIQALGQRRFLQHLFQRFSAEHPPASNGARADFETFVAACYLACGSEPQQAFATAWFQGDPISDSEREAAHLVAPCEGEEKARNALFTLQALAGEPLCIALDQLDESYRTFTEAGRLANLWERLAWVVNSLGTLPGLALIFAFEQIIWEGKFRREAPNFLIDRMRADGGELRLPPLQDKQARELIQRRLEVYVWSRHPDLRPAQPLFPFTAEEVSSLRREADGELRDFLNRARALYLKKLYPVPRLLELAPSEGEATQPTRVVLRGTHLPRSPRVLFGDRAAVSVTCTPERDEIHATTPTGLLGECVVVVLDAGSGEPIEGTLSFTFRNRPPLPRPLHQHIDRARLREARSACGLSQVKVARSLGRTANWFGKFERGESDAEDAVIEQLAELYGVPLESLLGREDG